MINYDNINPTILNYIYIFKAIDIFHILIFTPLDSIICCTKNLKYRKGIETVISHFHRNYSGFLFDLDI